MAIYLRIAFIHINLLCERSRCHFLLICLFVCLFHRFIFVLPFHSACTAALLFCYCSVVRMRYDPPMQIFSQWFSMHSTIFCDAWIFLYSPRFIHHSKPFSIKHCMYLYANLSAFEFAHTRSHVMLFFVRQMRQFHLEWKKCLVNSTSNLRCCDENQFSRYRHKEFFYVEWPLQRIRLWCRWSVLLPLSLSLQAPRKAIYGTTRLLMCLY